MEIFLIITTCLFLISTVKGTSLSLSLSLSLIHFDFSIILIFYLLKFRKFRNYVWLHLAKFFFIIIGLYTVSWPKVEDLGEIKQGTVVAWNINNYIMKTFAFPYPFYVIYWLTNVNYTFSFLSFSHFLNCMERKNRNQYMFWGENFFVIVDSHIWV